LGDVVESDAGGAAQATVWYIARTTSVSGRERVGVRGDAVPGTKVAAAFAASIGSDRNEGVLKYGDMAARTEDRLAPRRVLAGLLPLRFGGRARGEAADPSLPRARPRPSQCGQPCQPACLWAVGGSAEMQGSRPVAAVHSIPSSLPMLWVPFTQMKEVVRVACAITLHTRRRCVPRGASSARLPDKGVARPRQWSLGRPQQKASVLLTAPEGRRPRG